MWLPSKRSIPLILFIAGMLLFPSVAAAEIVERILAVVNDELVLFTDLERDRIFCPGPASIAPLASSISDDERYPGLRALINKRLVVTEARRLNIALPSESIVDESLKTLVDRFGGQKPLATTMAAHGIDQQDVLAMLREHLLIRRFLDVRIFPFIRISPEQPKSSVSAMRNARASKRLERYLSRLRARATIEINPP